MLLRQSCEHYFPYHCNVHSSGSFACPLCCFENFSPNECKPTWAAGLRIGIPGGLGAKTAPLAFQTCQKTSAQIISVGAVTTS